MKDTELKREKGRALYAIYREGLEQGRFTSMRDAGNYISRQAAPRFYIDARTASLLIGKILAGVSLINLQAQQRRMIWRLYKDYKKFIADNPNSGLSRERIMDILVESPAPSFYMTPEAIRKVLRKEVQNIRSKLGW